MNIIDLFKKKKKDIKKDTPMERYVERLKVLYSRCK